MFESLGKLRRCYCVFYDAGLCTRPNCLYKHSSKSERDSGRRSRNALTDDNVLKEKLHVPAKPSASSPSLKYSSTEKNSAPMETKKRPYYSLDHDTTDSGNTNDNKKHITTLNIVNNSDSPGNSTSSDSSGLIEISNSNVEVAADNTDDSKTTFTQVKELSRIDDKEATNEIEMQTDSISKAIVKEDHNKIKTPFSNSDTGITSDNKKDLTNVNIVKNSDSRGNSASSSDIYPSVSNSFIAISNSNVEVVADFTDDSKITFTQVKELSRIEDKEATNEIEMKSEWASKTNDEKHLTNENIAKSSDSRGNSPSSSDICPSLSNSFIANSNVEEVADYTDDLKTTFTQMKESSRIGDKEATYEVEMKTESISKAIKKEDNNKITLPSNINNMMSAETAKIKCRNFLSYLLELSAKQNQQVAVKSLVQGLVDGKVNAEDFSHRLKKELNAKPRPGLAAFLTKSLPHLRNSLATNELNIDGIKPPLLSSVRPAVPVTDLFPKNQDGNTNDEIRLTTVNIVKNSDSKANSTSSSDICSSLSKSFITISNSNVKVDADYTDDSKTTFTQMKELSRIEDKEATNEIEKKSEWVSMAMRIYNNIQARKTNEEKHLTNVNIVKQGNSLSSSPSDICPILPNSFLVISNSNVEVFADNTVDSKTTFTQVKELSRIVNKEGTNEIEMKTESISKPSTKKEDHSRVKTLKSDNSIAVMSPSLTISNPRQSRIPDEIRQKMLLRIHKEYCQMDKNSIAIVKAITCEKDVAMNSNLKKVYFASINTRILGIRRLVKQFKSSRRVTNIFKTGTSNNSERDAVLAQQSLNESSESTLYASLETLTLNSEDMMRFGYPISRPNAKHGRATYYKIVDGDTIKMGKTVMNKDVRNCDRCKSMYRVNEDGYPARDETCLYHYGHRLESVEKGETGLWYTCCNGESGSEGCTDAPAHVTNDPGCKFFRRGFVQPQEIEIFWDIISMDCSMVYTTVAKELAKITIVDINKEILYEQLVMPRNPILDYNSRSSDITEEKLFEGPTVYLEDVQTFLLSNISPNTIIIGHNLDSGLKAVKLIHTKVVDTSILFSKSKGSRTNQSLETLSGEFCRRIIASSSSKYNSLDNAITALELAVLKANKIRNKRDHCVKNKLNVSTN